MAHDLSEEAKKVCDLTTGYAVHVVDLAEKGALQLHYVDFKLYKQRCFHGLVCRLGIPNRNKSLKKTLWKAVSEVLGTRLSHEANTRKAMYNEAILELSAKYPRLPKDGCAVIAKTGVKRLHRDDDGSTSLTTFRPDWDFETTAEYLKYRRSPPPIETVSSLEDIKNYIMRYIDERTLSSRRKTIAYVMRRRHFLDALDDPLEIRAIDCSFKYTGSAYAYEKISMGFPFAALYGTVPEIFFKHAGRKIRQRKYAPWLRENENNLADIARALSRLSPEQIGVLSTWHDVERASEKWHRDASDIDTVNSSYAPYPSLKDIPVVAVFNRCKFELLDSPMKLAIEGYLMAHCINSYASEVAAGYYLAYSVTRGEERATLGVLMNSTWQFDQVRTRRNGTPSRSVKDASRKFAKLLGAGFPVP